MIRTINYTKVVAKGIVVENGEIKSIDLEPYTYTGRKLSQPALDKILKDSNADKKLQSIVIISETVISKKYEISLADFLAHAKEVEEDKQEETEKLA